MILRKITTADTLDFAFSLDLIIESFPPNERRNAEEISRLADTESDYALYLLSEGDQRIGVLVVWEFEYFLFAEHFAISPEYRNGGYGRKIMEAFLSSLIKPLLIEVELPETEIAQRRIGFYERLGFKTWAFMYAQPAYDSDYEPVPMILMTYGAIDLEKEFQNIRKALYKKVYNIQEV